MMLDTRNSAAKKIINLSKTDFPEGNNLEILETGEINKK